MRIKNYKPLIIDKLKELQEKAPDYSFCQVLYSFLREKMIGYDTNIKGLGNLCEITDEDIFNAIEKAVEYEIEYKLED